MIRFTNWRKAACCGLFLLTSACSSLPLRARHDLIGMDRSNLIACAGVPDNVATLSDGEVLQWRQDQQVQGPFTLKGPMSLELDLSGHGTCHFVARLRQGRVAQVEYTGPSGTLLGPYSACRPLVLACERQVRKG
ncbi:MAG: hypothetical protein LKI99_04775 [Acetobacter fabarum]|nr:hypothetical protein [Acetobacter fabarum]MCI1927856.1 hypothetical protein [Acetobacter fabarum]MCI1947873.1 hypothetical protein [Acetobacter fabarum]MCI1988864.1 hypothetical protein [Acetobacter fabarum]MCI2024310.1 hypothetical protein [Acetobacter fabarum]